MTPDGTPAPPHPGASCGPLGSLSGPSWESPAPPLPLLRQGRELSWKALVLTTAPKSSRTLTGALAEPPLQGQDLGPAPPLACAPYPPSVVGSLVTPSACSTSGEVTDFHAPQVLLPLLAQVLPPPAPVSGPGSARGSVGLKVCSFGCFASDLVMVVGIFFFVSCLLYQSRSRDLFIGWEYCVLSHKETQTGDCQLVPEERSGEPSATGSRHPGQPCVRSPAPSGQHVSLLLPLPRTAGPLAPFRHTPFFCARSPLSG